MNPGGEKLTIELHEVVHDYAVDLGDDPGLAKDGVEAELQDLISPPRRRACATACGWCGVSTPPTSGRSISSAATATAARW